MGEYAHVKETPGPNIPVGPQILRPFRLEFLFEIPEGVPFYVNGEGK